MDVNMVNIQNIQYWKQLTNMGLYIIIETVTRNNSRLETRPILGLANFETGSIVSKRKFTKIQRRITDE
jgi:hypothetical protein